MHILDYIIYMLHQLHLSVLHMVVSYMTDCPMLPFTSHWDITYISRCNLISTITKLALRPFSIKVLSPLIWEEPILVFFLIIWFPWFSKSVSLTNQSACGKHKNNSSFTFAYLFLFNNTGELYICICLLNHRLQFTVSGILSLKLHKIKENMKEEFN